MSLHVYGVGLMGKGISYATYWQRQKFTLHWQLYTKSVNYAYQKVF